MFFLKHIKEFYLLSIAFKFFLNYLKTDEESAIPLYHHGLEPLLVLTLFYQSAVKIGFYIISSFGKYRSLSTDTTKCEYRMSAREKETNHFIQCIYGTRDIAILCFLR